MAAHGTLPFAEQLRRFRRDRGLTQEELAEQAGLSARGIRALEAGDRSSPHKDTVRLLAEALGLTPDQRVTFEQSASVPISDAAREGLALPIAGFLGALPAGQIIARQEEIRHLFAVLDQVLAGAGRLIMLAGEPGVGKTRLAQEVTVGARARDFLVASGSCYEPEQSIPYYPFLEALTVLYGSAPTNIRADVSRQWPHLELLLPDSPRVVSAGDMSGQDIQQRLFWAVTGFLRAVAQAAPVALMLDDMHWADESSLKLLRQLARQTRGSRVLLLCTYRDTEIGRQDQLERALLDLNREGLLEEIPVRRLDQQGTAVMTAAILGEPEVSPEFATLVHRHTDGNPFFTQEMTRALGERGDVQFRDGTWDSRAVEEIEVPRSVRSAIGERVSRLSDGAQELLREASVLGQTFVFDDLWNIGNRTEEEVEEALEEALAAMLIRINRNDEYSFNHALTQQTLYSELSPRRRKRLHAAIGEALDQLPESMRRRRAAQIAWHYLQADSRERALPLVMLAGDEAGAVFAHSEAEQHYRNALDLAREQRDRAREVEGLEKLGMVLKIVARHDEALDMLERAANLSADAGDVEGEARAIREIGIVHYSRGTPEQGIVRIHAMTARLEGQSPTVQRSRAFADLYAALALDLWPAARYSEVLATTEAAAEFARMADYTPSRAIAETHRGMALTMIGPLPEARRVLEEATLLCEESGITWQMINTVGNAGRAYLDEGDFGKGREYLERSRALSDATHDRTELAWIESNIGEASYLVGDWADARATFTRAVRTARDVDSARYLSYALTGNYDPSVLGNRDVDSARYLSYALLHLAELSAAEGSWDEAKGHIDEGLESAQQCGAVPSVRKGHRLLAEHDLIEGRAEQALDRLHPLLGSPERDWPRAFPPTVLAEAYLELGDVARAEELVQQRVQRFRGHNHRRALALWLRLQGIILSRQQQWEETDRVFAEAVSLAQRISYPYAEAQARHERGCALAGRGAVQPAREQLQQALAIFVRLGAKHYIQKADEMLARLA